MELQEHQKNHEDNLSPSVSSLSHSNSTDKKKRTRDLPNLTQCHSCGFRIDSCSGNDILEILFSEWRIVLLCQNCFVGVESSNLCSYCFKSGLSDDCFSCPQCNHIIHKTCFSSHANVAPWSFSRSTTHFSVCLDCWVPKLVADKRAYCSSKRKNPLAFDLGNCRKRLLKNVVRDVNCGAHRKVETDTRARELAVEKAIGARRTALGMIGDRDDNAVSGIDDGAMNCSSSLKVSRKFSSVSSNCLVTNGSCRVSPVISVPETSVLVWVSDYDTSMNLDSNGNDNMRVPLKEGEGGCSNKFVNSASQSCRGGKAYDTRNFMKYDRKASANVVGDGKPDRYMIKYTRRGLAHENRYLIKYARRTCAYQKNKGKADRFEIKYTRRKLNQRPIVDSKSNCLNC